MISDLLQRKKDVLVELFKRGVYDSFVTKNGKRNEKQLQAFKILRDNDTSEFSYGGAAGGAKSWTGCTWLAMMCILYPNTKWFIGRVELKRLRESTLITFFKVCREYNITGWKYNGQDHFILFENGSRIDLLELEFKPSDPMFERYGSTEYTGGWIEEAGEVHFGAYDTLKSRINRHLNDEYKIKAKIFVTLNPKKNWVYEYFWKPYKENKLPKKVVFLQSFAYDNPFNQEGYIDQLKGIKDKVKRARLLDGDFEYDNDPLAIMTYEKILELFNNSFVEHGEPYQTCDIAYEGSDIFVIGIWEGLRLKKVIPRDKINDVHVPAWVNEHRITYKVPMGNLIYDADGLQKFTKQSTKTGHLMGAKEFHNGGKPFDPAYFNLKAECYFKLAELVETNQIYIEDLTYKDQIIQELEQIRKLVTDDNKIRLERKSDLRERLGRSPDFADMIMMRMLPLLKPKFTPIFGL